MKFVCIARTAPLLHDPLFYMYLCKLTQPGASIAPQVSANHPRGDFAYLSSSARIFVEF